MKNLAIVYSIFLLTACSAGHEETAKQQDTSQHRKDSVHTTSALEREVIQDKVLGMLLGSAIGDAMGAPTEMWSRESIRIAYGYVNDLDTMVREPSAEGIWDFNLPAGGTTDDTRWKKLMAEYLLTQNAWSPLNPQDFAQHIISKYEADIKALKNTESFDPEPFEVNARKLAWLQEWAMVAKPFLEDDLQGYAYALSQFYGGEMTCAGMLYSPLIGAFYPASPQMAYEEAYKLSLFDLGYARDISGLTAALVSAAMDEKATPATVMNTVRDIDPQGYFKSRLVGRTAYRMLQEARNIVYQANQLQMKDVDADQLIFPKNETPDTLWLARTQKAYELLDARNQDLPFHAGEIHLVNLTALLFCAFDFEKSLAFVVNFGRDNDTTAAVTGAILGAYYGADQLPSAMVAQVLNTNKTLLDTDLQSLASKLTNRIMSK
ncbi:ADP-ribosylglycohydrolase family protein [Catalinimonas niigatensis]|uniref:ADP-ribosylglycohydrolase family protein n=1 Tax=Catalinimonas niigatensis TaxID=1397264 RepID=UPI0026659DC6|nr:ADP-ribosylglycohydrolase family protein [Catalinimonas niigatensis]WPP53220.1 ADP-ribosylglycohydrolase family protein [Catalinimonas niigatensis]